MNEESKFKLCKINLNDEEIVGNFDKVVFFDTGSKIDYFKYEDQGNGCLHIKKAKVINKLIKVVFHLKEENQSLNLPKRVTVTQGNKTYKLKLKSDSWDVNKIIFEADQKLNEEKETPSTLTRFTLVIIFLCVITALFLYTPDENREYFSNVHLYRSAEEFHEKFQVLEASFLNQHEVSMNILRKSGIRHLKKVHSGEKSYDLTPSSFLIASFEDTSDMVNCFASELCKAYTHDVFEEIDCEDFSGGTDVDKKKLDDAIKGSLKDKQKVVVIKNIEKLSFGVAQLFMTYADAYNSLSTYPQSTIIMTTNLVLQSEGDRKTDEKQVSAYFRQTLWNGQANINSIAALWTRVGDGLAVLKHVENVPCTKKV